jgi:hypothetical protein
MHTRNVNVKTAAQESSRKMGENGHLPQGNHQMPATTESQKPAAMAFFQPSNSRVWDYAVQSRGEWCTRGDRKTLAQLLDMFPDMELITTTEALERENEQFRAPWVEITEARYIDQLEVQRVVDWCRSTRGESFRTMEVVGGDVTSILFRRDGRFFECCDLDSLSHDELAAQIGEQFFARNVVKFGH